MPKKVSRNSTRRHYRSRGVQGQTTCEGGAQSHRTHGVGWAAANKSHTSQPVEPERSSTTGFSCGAPREQEEAAPRQSTSQHGKPGKSSSTRGDRHMKRFTQGAEGLHAHRAADRDHHHRHPRRDRDPDVPQPAGQGQGRRPSRKACTRIQVGVQSYAVDSNDTYPADGANLRRRDRRRPARSRRSTPGRRTRGTARSTSTPTRPPRATSTTTSRRAATATRSRCTARVRPFRTRKTA